MLKSFPPLPAFLVYCFGSCRWPLDTVFIFFATLLSFSFSSYSTPPLRTEIAAVFFVNIYLFSDDTYAASYTRHATYHDAAFSAAEADIFAATMMPLPPFHDVIISRLQLPPLSFSFSLTTHWIRRWNVIFFFRRRIVEIAANRMVVELLSSLLHRRLLLISPRHCRLSRFD